MTILARVSAGRILLHLLAMMGDRRVRFHLEGIVRELPSISNITRGLVSAKNSCSRGAAGHLADDRPWPIPLSVALANLQAAIKTEPENGDAGDRAFADAAAETRDGRGAWRDDVYLLAHMAVMIDGIERQAGSPPQ
jgi:hypothetical protein